MMVMESFSENGTFEMKPREEENTNNMNMLKEQVLG